MSRWTEWAEQFAEWPEDDASRQGAQEVFSKYLAERETNRKKNAEAGKLRHVTPFIERPIARELSKMGFSGVRLLLDEDREELGLGTLAREIMIDLFERQGRRDEEAMAMVRALFPVGILVLNGEVAIHMLAECFSWDGGVMDPGADFVLSTYVTACRNVNASIFNYPCIGWYLFTHILYDDIAGLHCDKFILRALVTKDREIWAELLGVWRAVEMLKKMPDMWWEGIPKDLLAKGLKSAPREVKGVIFGRLGREAKRAREQGELEGLGR